MEKHLWLANLRRAVLTPYFYASAALIAAVILFTAIGVSRKTSGVTETFSMAISGSGISFIIYGILPPVAFAMNYAADQTAGAVNFWTIRSGTGRYARGQFAASVLFGYGAVFLGALLSILLLSCFLPFIITGSYDGAYTTFLENKQPVLYLLAKCVRMGLSGAVMSAVAFWVGSIVPNRLVVLAAPMVLYLLLLRATTIPNLPSYLKISVFIESGFNIQDSWPLSILVNLAATVVLCAILGEASVFHIRRRQRHA